MKFKTLFLLVLVQLALNCSSFHLEAAPAIFIPGESGRVIPIYISGFNGEADKTLRFDLEVAGCSIVSQDSAQYLVGGSNNGNVQGRLTDPHNNSTLLSKSYSGASVRRQAHAFADDIVLKITGKN